MKLEPEFFGFLVSVDRVRGANLYNVVVRRNDSSVQEFVSPDPQFQVSDLDSGSLYEVSVAALKTTTYGNFSSEFVSISDNTGLF